MKIFLNIQVAINLTYFSPSDRKMIHSIVHFSNLNNSLNWISSPKSVVKGITLNQSLIWVCMFKSRTKELQDSCCPECGFRHGIKDHQGTSRREIWHWSGMGRWRAWWQASLTSTAKSMTLLDCTQDVHRWCFHITHHCTGGMYPYFTDHHVFPPSSHPIMNF